MAKLLQPALAVNQVDSSSQSSSMSSESAPADTSEVAFTLRLAYQGGSDTAGADARSAATVNSGSQPAVITPASITPEAVTADKSAHPVIAVLEGRAGTPRTNDAPAVQASPSVPADAASAASSRPAPGIPAAVENLPASVPPTVPRSSSVAKETPAVAPANAAPVTATTQAANGPDQGGHSPQHETPAGDASVATPEKKERSKQAGPETGPGSDSSPAPHQLATESPANRTALAPADTANRARPEGTKQAEAPALVSPTVPDNPPAASKSASIREIALTLPGTEDKPVELHIVDSGGKLHVEVRTSDSNLASSLRENVGDLVQKLDRSGFRAEEAPAHKDLAVSGTSNSSNQSPNDNGRRSGTDQEQTAGQGGQSGQQQQQGQGRGHRPRWLEEIVRNFQSTVQKQESEN